MSDLLGGAGSVNGGSPRLADADLSDGVGATITRVTLYADDVELVAKTLWRSHVRRGGYAQAVEETLLGLPPGYPQIQAAQEALVELARAGRLTPREESS